MDGLKPVTGALLSLPRHRTAEKQHSPAQTWNTLDIVPEIQYLARGDSYQDTTGMAPRGVWNDGGRQGIPQGWTYLEAEMLDRTFLANALPNSTPHWSKLLIPQTNPCRKGPGRCRKSEKKIERDKERDKERHRVRKHVRIQITSKNTSMPLHMPFITLPERPCDVHIVPAAARQSWH